MRTGTISMLLAGLLLLTSLAGGCGGEKYRLNFDGYGFESKRTEYAAGEKVTVYYDLIATDTDYTFTIDEDVEWKRDYDNAHGYIFRFTMPAHDVTISVESRNSMLPDPDAQLFPAYLTQAALKKEIDEENWVFDRYSATVATVGGDGYRENTLYTRPEGAYGGGLLLASYSKHGDGPESVRVCVVSDRVLDECLAAAERHGMRDWKDGVSMTGAFHVVKWKEGDKVIRVTSDDMPLEGGEAAFSEIDAILGEAWSRYGLPEDEPDADGGELPEGAVLPGGGSADGSSGGPEGLREGEWFCPECGARNAGRYCHECGTAMPEPESVPEPEEAPDGAPEEDTPGA